jgi:CheY-like chemotaxis protein
MTRAGAILVVDDDAAVRDALRVLLGAEGYDVMTAADGAEAIASLRAGNVRLVFLDLAMPGVDGWEFLARRAAEPDFPPAPVVLLSGLPFIHDAPGVADFLRKPIDPDGLLDCVRRLSGPSATRARGAGRSSNPTVP